MDVLFVMLMGGLGLVLLGVAIRHQASGWIVTECERPDAEAPKKKPASRRQHSRDGSIRCEICAPLRCARAR